ncbi:hypothetical protein SMD44_p10078 (plasmid) [Streptomyces alboflavus]|uniref:IrrE N-terminal-like domain-containing protein n=1 Tax=Streptomyces alboflavus TaxID=67267 RepID=A0A291W3U2_9ACTN|nr:hypothetical protein [Streptomyces alboflavus]ATM24577.1 hypothetical protein SMD44_p10078 [Streptomyces alboflavus]
MGDDRSTHTPGGLRRTLHERIEARKAARRARAADRQLEHRLREQLRELGVEPPLTVEALCRAVEKKRGRPVILAPKPLSVHDPQGLWLETRHHDIVMYQEHTTPWHQRHIILHEIMGHMFGNHRADPSQRLVIPGLTSAAVRQVMTRCAYDTADECEAEKAATVVTVWADLLDEVTSIAPTHPELRRVHQAMRDRRGWL